MTENTLNQLGEESAAIGRLLQAMQRLVEDTVNCDQARDRLLPLLSDMRQMEGQLTAELHYSASMCRACGRKSKRDQC